MSLTRLHFRLNVTRINFIDKTYGDEKMRLEKNNQQSGMLAATLAYIIWGLLPVYWKLIEEIPAFEILAHRILWAFVFTVALLLCTGQAKSYLSELKDIIHHRKRLFSMVLASVLISANWCTYIWAVNNNHIIETTIGYYINPLVSVMLGIIVLKEKLSLWQGVAICLAFIGVLNMTVHFGSVPWIALTLAISFGLYGLVKKTVKLGAISGIATETLLVCPIALIYLVMLENQGIGSYTFSLSPASLLLMGAGVVTAVPLVLFARGAQRLPLTIIGLLQYIAPTIALLLGVFIYNESFTHTHLVSFCFIWTALLLFSLAKNKYLLQLEALLVKKLFSKTKETHLGS